jgi:hypothetical protein
MILRSLRENCGEKATICSRWIEYYYMLSFFDYRTRIARPYV